MGGACGLEEVRGAVGMERVEVRFATCATGS
jgi:hypothetical protein